MKTNPRCYVCEKPIPKERADALKMLGKPPEQWTHVACSTEQRKQGIYMGEAGTSELRIVKKVYHDSVHDVFRPAEREIED